METLYAVNVKRVLLKFAKYMAVIIHDETTNWKWQVRNANYKGEVEEQNFDTHEEAQKRVDEILADRIKYLETLGRIANNKDKKYEN